MNAGEPFSPEERARLIHLYKANAKHGDYHPLPCGLEDLLPSPRIDPRWRGPRPRVALLARLLSADMQTPIVEIGANSGYQALSLARHFPERPYVAIEANSGHAEFIEACGRLLNVPNLVVECCAVTPVEVSVRWPDATVLDFNVAHHLGVDLPYPGVNDPDGWWSTGLPDWLATARRHPEYWFSCGFRMGGDRGMELHSPEDAGGFLERWIAIFDPPPGSRVDYWIAADSSEESPSYVTASRLEPVEISSAVNRASATGVFRGEFFRRPLVRLRHPA